MSGARVRAGAIKIVLKLFLRYYLTCLLLPSVGGHETAWASFQGLEKFIKNKDQISPRIGIINFDAHFDLRSFESVHSDVRPSSGTPFNQIAHFCSSHGWPFQYACLGVSRTSNTEALFERANNLKVLYIER